MCGREHIWHLNLHVIILQVQESYTLWQCPTPRLSNQLFHTLHPPRSPLSWPICRILTRLSKQKTKLFWPGRFLNTFCGLKRNPQDPNAYNAHKTTKCTFFVRLLFLLLSSWVVNSNNISQDIVRYNNGIFLSFRNQMIAAFPVYLPPTIQH